MHILSADANLLEGVGGDPLVKKRSSYKGYCVLYLQLVTRLIVEVIFKALVNFNFLMNRIYNGNY